MIALPTPARPTPPGLRAKANRAGFSPCAVCGRAVRVAPGAAALHVHKGGSHAVTEAEAAELNAAGQGSADLGRQFVGSECLRSFPDLRPYVEVLP
jgi:hypothetical protein